MKRVNCKTQKQCDAALKDGDLPVLIGDGWFRIQGHAYVVAWGSSHVVARESSHVEARESSYVEAWGSSHVVAWESSHVEARESSHVEARESSYVEAWGSSHVVAWGSSHVVARESSHVEARESSNVEAWGSSHVEAWESSHVEARGSSHVEARESSNVVAWGSSHVEAWGSSHVEARESSNVEAWGSSHVVATKFVAVRQHPGKSTVSGGVIIAVPAPKTPADWCEFYGAKHDGEVAILFKAVGDDYRSPHRTNYAPGTMPEAEDWDGGQAECGGGLHFCAHPLAALGFNDSAKRFVACPVRLVDISVHPSPCYPNKIKAKRVCAPIYEVDRYGSKLETAVANAS